MPFKKLLVVINGNDNCDKLNKEDGFFKKGASIGMGNLIRSGAHVHIVNGIHNKTLARDEDLIAEGSFNWLSAVRARGAEMQREERTLVVEGGEVSPLIRSEAIKLRSMKQLSPKPAARSNIRLAVAVLIPFMFFGFAARYMFFWNTAVGDFAIILLIFAFVEFVVVGAYLGRRNGGTPTSTCFTEGIEVADAAYDADVHLEAFR